MTDHRISKRSLFISHATSDGDFANAVQREIEKVFANGIDVFCTSSPGSIQAGSDWLSSIEQKLDTAQAVVAIVTPVSIERPWLWFEVGATWSKGRSGACRIYPFCAPELDLSDLPSPLDRLQALSMGKDQDIRMLFEALIRQFGFGKLSSLRTSNISRRIPKYKDVDVMDIDLNERILYSGPYTGYRDEELEEIIDTRLFLPDDDKYHSSYPTLYSGREDLIHNGKLIHFRQVDERHSLPPGTARRLLNRVAERYALDPILENGNIVRYRYKSNRHPH